MLEPKEFNRLQQLANIKLSPDEQAKLGKQLDNIIQFIGQLDQMKISSTKHNISGLSLRTIAGVHISPDAEDLLRNVRHPLANRSIVIKSSLV